MVLTSRSCISFFGLRCGLAEEHSIVYNFRLTEIFVVESCHVPVVMSEVSQVPQGVAARAGQVLGVFLIMKS